MAKRQTRPLTPAEAVRRGRKLIVERQRQEAARKAAMEPEAAGLGGAGADMGKPITEQDQRVEVVSNYRKIPGSSPAAAAAPSAKPKAIPDQPLRDKSAPQSAILGFVVAVPESASHPDGTWPLTDLRSGQCRFACTADDAPRDQHRFCGRPTRISRSNLHGSWCDEHLPRVWGTGSVSERNAHHVTKDVRRFG
ncbi:hypothetical protein ACSD7O_14160 [Methylorubrum extorquens]|uniref:hypothetical protein n=1 Tax=Methylorubrum extorquens TaxID=408 RepID=UPI003F5E7B4C